MARNRGNAARALAAAAGIVVLAQSARAGGGFQPRYAIHDLGNLGGGATAAALNDAGQVAGSSLDLGGREHAFRWDPAAGMRLLHAAPAGGTSRAAAINAAGEVAGTAIDASGRRLAFVWSDGEGLRSLGTLGGDGSEAYAINDRGMVVGAAQRAGGETLPFTWTRRSGIRALDRRTGAAFAVNRRGDAAGTAGSRGAVWRAGSRRLLTSGTAVRGTRVIDAHAYALNDRGVLVGDRIVQLCRGRICFPRAQPVIWRSPRRPVAPDALVPGRCLDINNSGTVVGFHLSSVACAWDPDGRRTDLTTVLPQESSWSLRAARAINEAGQIVGDAAMDGSPRAFLLTPVTWRSGADLGVTLIPNAAGYPVGGAGIYTVRVTNYGPDPAEGVTVFQELAAGAPFAGAEATTGGVVHDAGTLTWSVGDLPAGGSARLLVDFTVEALIDFASAARAESARMDPYPLNNAASALARAQPGSGPIATRRAGRVGPRKPARDR